MVSRQRTLRVLVWHVHGSWMTSFVQGPHEYLVPTLADGGEWGRGFCGRQWPANVQEVPVADLRAAEVDIVVLQRPEEWELASRWLGREVGEEIPAIYVEHNTPSGPAATTRHPMADHAGLIIAHVTHFNQTMWDCGRAQTRVITHGIVDPGHIYTGRLPRAAVLINEPVRRWRTVGADLLAGFAGAIPVDVYGIDVDGLGQQLGLAPERVTARGDLRQKALHEEMADRRVYIHTARWTSLGLSLIEAMMLGMPIVALASTEAAMAVPAGAGIVSTDPTMLTNAARRLAAHPTLAREMGTEGRRHALAAFGLDRFIDSWDLLLSEVWGHSTRRGTGGRR